MAAPGPLLAPVTSAVHPRKSLVEFTIFNTPRISFYRERAYASRAIGLRQLADAIDRIPRGDGIGCYRLQSSRLGIPKYFYGIDWSGAKDAGRKIWIAGGRRVGSTVVLMELSRGAELPGSGVERSKCHRAVRDWITRRRDAAIGLDFPFSLPSVLVEERNWEAFVHRFPERHRDPDSFRKWCRASSANELKRVTDRLARAPFSPWNLRIYRQTYWGIHSLLAPLSGDPMISVVPMQAPVDGGVWLLESCPASTLKRHDLYRPYKGSTRRLRRARTEVLDELIRLDAVHVKNKVLRRRIRDDVHGDALDAVIAMTATHRAVQRRDFPRCEWRRVYALEAYIYF